MPAVTYTAFARWNGIDYTAIIGDVKSISIRRGRSADMGSMQQGVCTISLADTTGKYNPENAGSSLAGNLLPMRQVYVEATYSGTTYRLFDGQITRIEHDPLTRESTIEAVDLTEYLSHAYATYYVALATQTNKTVGYVLDYLLDNTAGVAILRDLDDGPIIPSVTWTDATKTVLSYMEDLIAADPGWLFIAGDGTVTYRDTTGLYGSAVVATFTGAMASGISSTIQIDGIVNRQTVTMDGSTAQTAIDAISIAAYGQRTGSDITSSYLASDAQAMSLAQLIVATHKNPQSPARTIALWNADATRLVQMLARELGDVVTVNVSDGGTLFSGWIAGVEHDIWEGGKFHKTTFTVQKRPFAFFVIDTSKIASADVIGYV